MLNFGRNNTLKVNLSWGEAKTFINPTLTDLV